MSVEPTMGDKYEAVTDIADELEAAAEKLREVGHFPDASEGKVVWPVKGEGADEWLVGETDVSHADALATLWEIADCDLELTGLKEGSGATGDIALAVAGVQTYTDAPFQFFYVPIRQAIEKALEEYFPEEGLDAKSPEGRSQRLLKALLRVYAEWEAEGQ